MLEKKKKKNKKIVLGIWLVLRIAWVLFTKESKRTRDVNQVRVIVRSSKKSRSSFRTLYPHSFSWRRNRKAPLDSYNIRPSTRPSVWALRGMTGGAALTREWRKAQGDDGAQRRRHGWWIANYLADCPAGSIFTLTSYTEWRKEK